VSTAASTAEVALPMDGNCRMGDLAIAIVHPVDHVHMVH
jgi:hypothetical protein